MAEKEASVPLQGNEENEKRLQAWQMAWIRHHNDRLVERMSTIDIADQLTEVGRIETKMDVYQKIEIASDNSQREGSPSSRIRQETRLLHVSGTSRTRWPPTARAQTWQLRPRTSRWSPEVSLPKS